MGLDFLFVYLGLMLLLGPGTILFGVVIAVRRRVRLSQGKVLHGKEAVFAGIATMISGIAFMGLLWYMGRYLPH